jgi:hypothetical protein
MANPRTVFGIDFGTTNTRIAYCDARRQLRMVPVRDRRGESYSLPTTLACDGGDVVAYGYEAREHHFTRCPPRPIKWLLATDTPVEIGGREYEPVQLAAEFFRHLRAVVREAGLPEALNQAAVTIPVDFPPRARANLQEALSSAGIEVTHFFPEPVAALYCDLFARPTEGVVSVFDWGGGSLDIALLQLRGNVARTLNVDGWHRGGDDFDRLVSRQAVNHFLAETKVPFDAEELLQGRTALLLQAERAKMELSRGDAGGPCETRLLVFDFASGQNLDFSFTARQFEDWVGADVDRAVALLQRRIRATGISPSVLARLMLSGGTCNIPLVRRQLERRVVGSDRIVNRLSIPERMCFSRAGLDDIGNATAVGAALLATLDTTPIFAADVGVRLAPAYPAEDSFFPVFNADELAVFNTTRKAKFYVSDAADGVARLLVCDRHDPVTQPAGRLLRVLNVPIDRQENWLNVEFRLDRYLSMDVQASGRIARAAAASAQIHQLNLGFPTPELPSLSSRREP